MVLLPGKPEVISREMVRPSTATPDCHRIHSLSFFDQLAPPIYGPLLYFYLNHESHRYSVADIAENKIRALKVSLSEALSTYYPLAGRMGDDPLTVHCNDEGVIFLQARMNTELPAILNHPDAGLRDEARKLLFPDDLCYKSTSLSSPLVVQVTSFECGGMALGICVSHKVLDMSSFCSFINYWAATASTLGHNIKLQPDHRLEFTLATLYPPVDLPVTKTVEPPKVRNVVNRFVFDASKIAKLKAIVGSKIENPTRVELALALLCSCAISAATDNSSSKGGGASQLRSALLIQAVNLRRRLMSPLPPARSTGNLSSVFAMSIAEGMEKDLVLLVSMIRRVKTEYFNSCAVESVGNQFRSFIIKTTAEFRKSSTEEAAKVYPCSSWCGFPIYEADFGWGKPVWVTAADFVLTDVIILLDTRDGLGIEAVVSLEEHEMAALERDQKLLAFARINPVVGPVMIRP
ncbi:unnamed protein product [Linum trigynum]|uniref:Uncharacterized protein n=1 Tax=Linum trigynum TaxID=586398 RepID=A0AAV2DQU6_9ROSI